VKNLLSNYVAVFVIDLIPFSCGQQISTVYSSLTSDIFTSDCHIRALGAFVEEVSRLLKARRWNLPQQPPVKGCEDFCPIQKKLKLLKETGNWKLSA